MLPADGILRAAQRWMRLLGRSTFPQAAALVKADPAYTDLSQTQYASALEWLRSVSLVIETENGLALAAAAQRLTTHAADRLIFARALEEAAPAWLPDADLLVPDAAEMPADVTNLAGVLGLSDTEAFLSVRQVHGHIDLAERARVGAAGERALVELLEAHWPGSSRHVSLDDDGLGYDVEFTHDNHIWHLEIKSTTRRGRLTVYLSRHEHEVAQLDPQWRLVVVGLDGDDQACAVATASTRSILGRSPRDLHTAARWESARHELTPADLQPGLHLHALDLSVTPRSETSSMFAWMP